MLRLTDCAVDLSTGRTVRDAGEDQLSTLELRLLTYLAERPSADVSRDELLSEVWGVGSGIGARTVDTHVRRLRERLGAYGDAIETVHGFGYRMREP